MESRDIMLKAFSTHLPLIGTLMLLISTGVFVILDVSILRQVTSFVFLSLVPGLIIVYIIELNGIKISEKFVLSVGLSISFLMGIGLLINYIYPFFGYSKPLSTNSMVISFSALLLILIAVSPLRTQTYSFAELLNDIQLNTKEKAFLIIPGFFPLLAIFGMRLMNATENNLMVMALLILIPAYAVFIVAMTNQVPERVYPLTILLCSISLVILLGLRSNHIIGSDVHIEYYLFQQTFDNTRWQILLNSTLDSCLSITILPTVYQSFLDIDSEYLFKMLYPSLFSISPLIIYIISKKYINSKDAFLTSLFFMSQMTFLWTAYNPRTNVAILFFALSVMVLFHEGVDELRKRLLFVIFSLSCIISHYSTTYVFFSVILFTWLFMLIIHKIRSSQNNSALSKYRPDITIGMLVFFFVVIFFWYSQITGQAFNSGVTYIASTLESFHELFILESRSEGVASALGSGIADKSISKKVHFVLSWLTIAFIAIGILIALARQRYRVIFICADKEQHPSSSRAQNLGAQFLLLSLTCSAMLVIALVVPHALKGYSMERAYCQMMVVLSLFFTIGGMAIAEHIHVRKRYSLIILAVLIPYFMCTTGTIYQLLGDTGPMTITLSSKGTSHDIMFVHDQESKAAKWLKKYFMENSKIYTDNFGERRLISQGSIYLPIYTSSLVELIGENRSIDDGYIYLRYCGVVDGKLYGKDNQWHYMTNYKNEFSRRNLIYSNGGSKIISYKE